MKGRGLQYKYCIDALNIITQRDLRDRTRPIRESTKKSSKNMFISRVINTILEL